jgi:DNA-binding NarL/FixJ family response regulator
MAVVAALAQRPPGKPQRTSGAPQGDRGVGSLLIILIDDRPLMRQCFGRWLEESLRDGRIITLASVAELLDEARSFREAHLIVLSIGVARVSDPEILDDIDRLAQALPEVPIVLLSDHEDVQEVARAIHHGVRGYIPTRLDLSEAAAGIRCVEAGGTFVPADILVRFFEHQQSMAHLSLDSDKTLWEVLTPREMEVIARLRQGKPNKVIAYELAISESTVKTFVRRILIKLRAVNRTEVAHLTEGQFDAIQAALNARRSRPPLGNGSG